MSPAVHTRSPVRRHSSDWSESPPKGRSSLRSRSPHRNSPRRGRSPERRRGSSPKMKSPTRNKSSHKGRSPIRDLSPKHGKHSLKSSSLSQSPSPRTKRLRRAQAERDAEKAAEKDRERNNIRGKYSERNSKLVLDKDVAYEKRTANDKHSQSSSRSRHEPSASPSEHNRRHSHHQSQSPRRHDNGASPGEHRRRHSNHRSQSPRRVDSGQERKHATKTGARDEVSNAKGSATTRDGDHDSVAKMKAAEEALEGKQKQKPSYELSGKLAEETNRVRGVTLLFTEPPDARKPDMRWRLYVFKAGEVLNDPLYVHRQSCYLFGRERRVADIPTDHPSCSKQHAVIQFRLVEKEGADGLMKKQVRPYLMDLGSTNGTFLNDNQIEPQRYYELFEQDTIKFGNSSREYVLLHENSVS